MNDTGFAVVEATPYVVPCPACAKVSDVALAPWCHCLGKDRTRSMSGADDWAALEALCARRLGERIMVMHETLAGVEAKETESYAFLASQFHSLAGIGGTLGHHDLTDIALDGEEACHRRAPAAQVAHFVALIANFGAGFSSNLPPDWAPHPLNEAAGESHQLFGN